MTPPKMNHQEIGYQIENLRATAARPRTWFEQHLAESMRDPEFAADYREAKAGIVHGPAGAVTYEEAFEEAAWDAAISAAKRREAAAEEVRWKLAIARAHRREEDASVFYPHDLRRWTRAEKIARDALGHHRVAFTEAYLREHKIQVWLERGRRATFADLDALHQALGTSAIDLTAVRGGHREETWSPHRAQVVVVEIRDLAPALLEAC